MQTIVTWVIVMAILCASIVVLCYVAHRSPDNGDCEEKKQFGCNGDCRNCKKETAQKHEG